MTAETTKLEIHVGCAGWAIGKEHSHLFPDSGTHLRRYSGEFNAVEINSSFYRPHKPSTYAKWSESVPANFRFAVKMPKQITHEQRLIAAEERLEQFLAEVSSLGEKLGPVLIQLPPSLRFSSDVAEKFLMSLRERFSGSVVLEPRHPSWFEDDANRLLASTSVARVAADPHVVPAAAEPGGWDGLQYYRLHGSPRVYYSSYPEPTLDALANKLSGAIAHAKEVWCIFDNTAAGAATINALDLTKRINRNEQKTPTSTKTQPAPPKQSHKQTQYGDGK